MVYIYRAHLKKRQAYAKAARASERSYGLCVFLASSLCTTRHLCSMGGTVVCSRLPYVTDEIFLYSNRGRNIKNRCTDILVISALQHAVCENLRQLYFVRIRSVVVYVHLVVLSLSLYIHCTQQPSFFFECIGCTAAFKPVEIPRTALQAVKTV